MANQADTKRVRMRTLSASPEGVFSPGAERTFPGDVADHLIMTGQAEPVDEPSEPAPEPEPADDGESDEFPRPTGAGWYELSNGDKVRGEDEAAEAEAALHEDG